jgi:PilZ domain
MRRLNGSLSRDEVRRKFGFVPGVVDALIDNGQLLCRMSAGEQHVPLDELEQFFREGLVRVYEVQAELAMQPSAEAVAPPPVRVERQASSPVVEPVPEPQPEATGEGACPPTGTPPPKPEPEAEADRPDSRMAMRYVPRRQIDGFFEDVRFTILQMSTSGLRIRHDEPLMPGQEAKLSFALLNPARSFVMRARVVWTSVAKYETDDSSSFCISGLRVIEHVERLARALEILKGAHELQPDRRVGARPGRRAGDAALSGISDDEVAAIMGAVQRFASDPLEASRWHSRARFALADAQVRRDAPQHPREREEALGVWEYLDRKVELPKIVSVLEWARQARVASV